MSTKWFDDSRGKTIPLIRIGKVVDDSDPNGVGAIKVRITGKDKNDSDDELPYALPLLPKFLNIFPEVGQAVFVFEYEHKIGLKTVNKSKRYWLGPIIPQVQNLNNANAFDAQSQESDGYTVPQPSVDTIPEAKGAYPNRKDIAIQGRDNTDVTLKPKEIMVRVGKFNIADPQKFNSKDPGYIHLKYGNAELKKTFKKITEKQKIIKPPTHLIRAVIKSELSDGTKLRNDLSPKEYENTTTNVAELTVTKIDDGASLYTFNQTFTGVGSRSQAAIELCNQVEEQQGQYTKWKLITPTYEVLDRLGEDIQKSKENQTVLYEGYYTEVEVTKEVETIEKGETQDEGSVINIVANKINLISHDGEHDFNLTDPEQLINFEEQKKINSDAHPIVYGDKLVEFLELVRDFIRDHTHPYHQDVAVDSSDKTNALDYDLQSILNKNINSN
jgi:hypothetical protein